MTTIHLGAISQQATKQSEIDAFYQQIIAHDTERKIVIDAGIPALLRLAKVADRDTGQSLTVRRFLLGLYNGYANPFNLVTLRGLDRELYDDVVAVLALDARVTEQEIHRYIKDGEKLFTSWAKSIRGAK